MVSPGSAVVIAQEEYAGIAERVQGILVSNRSFRHDILAWRALRRISNDNVYVFDPVARAWTVPNPNGMAYSRFYASQVPVTTPGVVEQRRPASRH